MVQSSQQNQYDNLRLFPPFFPKKLWAKRGYIELRNGRFIGRLGGKSKRHALPSVPLSNYALKKFMSSFT
jgi:hypothetical protein